MNNRLVKVMSIILVAITLVGVIAVVVITKVGHSSAGEDKPSIDEIVASTVDLPEITTNLATNDFVRISFTFQTDSKKGKEELTKRMFQVKNIIIEELSVLKQEDLQGKEGKVKLENLLQTKSNELMQDGKIEKVYITSYIIQ
jgi:flagellar FliL protein